MTSSVEQLNDHYAKITMCDMYGRQGGIVIAMMKSRRMLVVAVVVGSAD